MSDAPDSRPQIVVDENWKEQVAREKEAARGQQRANAGNPDEYPPASFSLLVSTYSTQALIALGLVPDPVSGKPKPNRRLARHLIDMLSLIGDLTKGNISDDERNMLESTLHQLRMAFLSAPESAPERGGGHSAAQSS